MTPVLADVSLTHPFIGNSVDRDQWANYQGKKLSHRAQCKSLKHAWAENVHVVVPFVSNTLGSMSGGSASTLCMCTWWQAEREAKFFMEDWGDGAGTESLASDCGEGHRSRCPRRQKLGTAEERVCPFPGDESVRTSVSFL